MVRAPALPPSLAPRSRTVLTVAALSSHPVAVLIWTIICLAIAAHFQSILLASDLSEYSFSAPRDGHGANAPPARFVPFAIFVCAATMVIIIAL